MSVVRVQLRAKRAKTLLFWWEFPLFSHYRDVKSLPKRSEQGFYHDDIFMFRKGRQARKEAKRSSANDWFKTSVIELSEIK